MIAKTLGALGCAFALVAVPTTGADGDSATKPVKPAKQKVCRVLPDAAQPKPASSPRGSRSGASQTLVVVVPRTTCNAGR